MRSHEMASIWGLMALLTTAGTLCAQPLVVTQLKATATDAETIKASWTAAGAVADYRVRVLEKTHSATEIPGDYSRFPNAWPDGWTCHEWWPMTTGDGGGFASPGGSSSKVWPHFIFNDAWFATSLYEEAITSLSFTYRGRVAVEKLEAHQLIVEARTAADGLWRRIVAVTPATTNLTQTLSFSSADGLRQLRFSAESSNPLSPPNFELSSFTVKLGADEEREVANVTVTGDEATVGGLSPDGVYTVEVTPIAAGAEVESVRSDPVTMAEMKRRLPVPVPFGTLRGRGYREDFSALADVSGTVALKALPSLAAWQFQSAETVAADMHYSKSYASNAAAGEYIVSDDGRTTNSYMLATRASGTSGAMFGVTFTNDTIFTISELRLSFDAVQLTATKNAKSQTVEWRLAAAAGGISEGENWQTIDLNGVLTAPVTTATAGVVVPCVQHFATLPLAGAKVAPGQVLVIRWRDDKLASSPWMGVDNVGLDFTDCLEGGFRLFVR